GQRLGSPGQVPAQQTVRIKCGFAELVDPVDYEVVARGSVSAYAIPDVGRGPWDGEIRLIRGYEHLRDLDGSWWLLRFEKGFSQRWIELRSVERQWAPSGL